MAMTKTAPNKGKTTTNASKVSGVGKTKSTLGSATKASKVAPRASKPKPKPESPKGERPTSYLAFRVGNAASGKYLFWTQRDESLGSFSHADEDKMARLREACHELGIPVYYFGLDVDRLDDAELLTVNEELPINY